MYKRITIVIYPRNEGLVCYSKIDQYNSPSNEETKKERLFLVDTPYEKALTKFNIYYDL
jgi:hypothetical protein